MAGLGEDRYARRSSGATRRHRQTSVGVLALAAAGLLAGSLVDHPFVSAARGHASEMLAPVFTAATTLSEPIRRLGRHVASHASLVSEVERLKAENQRLSGWEARARELERRVTHLAEIARVVEEPGMGFVTARVVVDAPGPFSRTAVIAAGREHGIRSGYPAISGDGLVGRVLDTGKTSARLLLLPDPASRIPVIVGPNGIEAILAGDQTPSPRLLLVPDGLRIESGAEVVTSGVGGLFPRGLRVGRARDSGGIFRVELYARIDALDFVSVLQFQSPLLELADGGEQDKDGKRAPTVASRALRTENGGAGR
jgi:rod shape-determining protein MreC